MVSSLRYPGLVKGYGMENLLLISVRTVFYAVTLRSNASTSRSCCRLMIGMSGLCDEEAMYLS